MNEKATLGLIVAGLLFVPLIAAGTVNFNTASPIHLSGTNTTVNLTGNVTDLKIYSDRVGLNGANFSVQNSSENHTDIKLHTFNRSAYSDQIAVNFTANTTDGHNVNFTLENFESDLNYTIERDEEHFEYVNSSNDGELWFNSSSWDYNNFTIEETRENTDPDVSLTLGDDEIEAGDSIEIECSASDEDGIALKVLDVYDPDEEKIDVDLECGDDFSETDEIGTYEVEFDADDNTGKYAAVTDSFEVIESSEEEENNGESGAGGSLAGLDMGDEDNDVDEFKEAWTFVDRRIFVAKDVEEDVEDVTEVQIDMVENVDAMSLTVRKTDSPDVEEIDNAYTYIELEVSGTGGVDVEESTIQFVVDKSFVEDYDNITAMRYNDGWNELPTEQVDSSGDEVIYEATTPGFSYFTIKGEETAEEDEQDEESTEDAGCENCTETDNSTDTEENNQQRADPNIMSSVTDKGTAIAVLLIMIAVTTGVSWNYRDELRSRIEEYEDEYLDEDLEEHLSEYVDKLKDYLDNEDTEVDFRGFKDEK